MSDELQEIYDEIPDIECKGECHESCGPIAYSDAEANRIEQSGESPPEPVSGSHRCDKLIPLVKKCSIYEDRPLICRLFGVVEGMKCPHGCKPEGGYLSDVRAFQLMRKAEKIDT
jgi:Fe-S-cluster containining protein